MKATGRWACAFCLAMFSTSPVLAGDDSGEVPCTASAKSQELLGNCSECSEKKNGKQGCLDQFEATGLNEVCTRVEADDVIHVGCPPQVGSSSRAQGNDGGCGISRGRLPGRSGLPGLVLILGAALGWWRRVRGA